MPIFCDTRLVIGGGRAAMSSPFSRRSIETAASWPCATAQMMFFGPKAASPPKKTLGTVDCIVRSSSFGSPHLSNSMPMSRSIQGKALSWPTATSTVVALEMRVGLAGRDQCAAPVLVIDRAHLLEGDAGQAAAVVGEGFGYEVVEDRDAFVHGVLLFPGAGLHLLEAGTDDDLDVLAAETARRAAAVHGRVAAAEDDHPLADRGDVAEGDARQPVDAEMDGLGRRLAAGNVEILAARRAGTDEDGVVAFGEQAFSEWTYWPPRKSTPRPRM
jgi:hypothetical protein